MAYREFRSIGQAYTGVSEGDMFVDEEAKYSSQLTQPDPSAQPPAWVSESAPSVYVGYQAPTAPAPTPAPSTSSSTLTTTDAYCPPHSRMCLKSEAVRAKAATACGLPARVRGFDTRGGLRGLHGLSGGLGRVCTIYDESHTVKVSEKMLGRWNPCYLKDLPLCPSTPFTPQFDPGPEEPEEEPEEDNSFMIGGILAAVLIAGGVGYAVFRKKKKKGKRKKR